MRSRHQAVAHLERVVGERPELEVLGRDVALAEHALAHPVHEPAPVVGPDEDHRELGDLARLDERERLPELVHRPVAAGEDDEAAGVADEHDLAREEVVELERDVAVAVPALLERQLDVEAYRQRLGLTRAAVGGLHDPGAAAGDDREATLADEAGGLAGELVVRIVGGRARRAEEARCGRDARERVEAHAQLLDDAVDAVLVGQGRADRRLLGGDDLFVEGARLSGHGTAFETRWPAHCSRRPPRFPLPPRRKYEFALPLWKGSNASRDVPTWTSGLDVSSYSASDSGCSRRSLTRARNCAPSAP